jgi:hypothetical protein
VTGTDGNAVAGALTGTADRFGRPACTGFLGFPGKAPARGTRDSRIPRALKR